MYIFWDSAHTVRSLDVVIIRTNIYAVEVVTDNETSITPEQSSVRTDQPWVFASSKAECGKADETVMADQKEIPSTSLWDHYE